MSEPYGQVISGEIRKFIETHTAQRGSPPELYVLTAEEYQEFLCYLKTLCVTSAPSLPEMSDSDVMFMGIRVIRGRSHYGGQLRHLGS